MNRIERARAYIVAGLAALTSAREELDSLEAEIAAIGCDHPEDARQDLSTFGQPAFRCRRCGVTVINEVETEEAHARR
jgi:hypothetical protein